MLFRVDIVPEFEGLIVGVISWFYKVFVTLTLACSICFPVIISFPWGFLYHIPRASPVGMAQHQYLPWGHQLADPHGQPHTDLPNTIPRGSGLVAKHVYLHHFSGALFGAVFMSVDVQIDVLYYSLSLY